jgi:hypothetical protein
MRWHFLCVPLLVLASALERAETRNLRLSSYLAYLSTKKTVDVHRYDQEPDDEGDYVQPVAMNTAAAVALFPNPYAGPVNFLNLDVVK